MQTLTLAEFRDTLMNLRGAKPVSLVSVTVPKLRAGNPFGPLRKRSYTNGMINWSYQNAVNKQRDREEIAEPFIAEPRKWGERIIRADGTLTPLVQHKGKYYIEMKIEKSLDHTYQDSEGNTIENKLVDVWLPEKKDGGRQEVERPVILRDYSLENIEQLTVNGETLVLEKI